MTTSAPPLRSLITLALAGSLQATENWTAQNVPATFDLHGIAAARIQRPYMPDRTSFFIAGQGGIWRGDQPLAGEWELVLSEAGSRYRAIAETSAGTSTAVEAVGDGGKVTRSLDGETWNSTSIAGAGNFTDLAADSITGIVVAVDDQGQIFSGGSVAGLARRHEQPGVAWHGVAFGNETWVAVGSAASVAVSNDANNWQVLPGALMAGQAAVDFHGVAYGVNTYQGGFFMAVGEEGSLSTSTEGTIWRVRQSNRGSARLLRAAAFASRHAAWLAVGDGGIGNIVHDAATGFTVANIGQILPQGMNRLVSARGFTVAVGDGGTVWTSVTGLNPNSAQLSAPPAGQLNVPPAGGNFTLQLANTSSAAKWRAEVASGEDFITVVPSFGIGNDPASFTIMVEPFGTVANRSGLVRINDIQIPIVQAGDGDPQPVTTLELEALTDRAILVRWRPAIGATDYEIRRRQESNVEFTPVATVPGAENSGGELEFVDQRGLLPNTTYCYEVVALNRGDATAVVCGGGLCNSVTYVAEFGRAAPSPQACDTTKLSGTTGFFGVVTEDLEAIELSWNPVPGAESYFLERSDSAAGFFPLDTLSGDASSYRDESIPGLDFIQCYRYRLTPSGGISRERSVCTPVPPPTVSVVAVDIPDMGGLEGAFLLTFAYHDFLSFAVEGRLEPGGRWISIHASDPTVSVDSIEVNGNIRTVTWRIVQPELTRSFRVRTRSISGVNPPSPWIEAGPISTPPPSDPTGFELNDRTANRADFTWNDAPHAVSYLLVVRPASAIDDSQDVVALFGADSTGGGVTGLFPGTTYDAFLIARGVEGERAVSRSSQGVASATLTFATLPSGPFPVTANVNGPTFISVTWGTVAGATGYEIWKSQFFGGGFTDYALFTSTTDSVLSTSDFTVEGSRTYRYAVRAQIGSEFTSFRESNIAHTPMDAPTITQVRPLDANSMLIQWTAASSSVQGYILERALSSGGPFSKVNTVLGTLFQAPPQKVIDTGLTAQRTYFYRVSAFQFFGEVSPPSNAESGTTFPRLQVANVTPTTLALSWDLIEDATRYLVGRSDAGSEGPYHEVGSVDHPGEKFSDSDLTPSTVYHYRVVPELAKGRLGEITEIREAATAPLPPSTLSALLTPSSPPQANLTWTAGSAADEYLIQWQPPGGSFMTFATNAAPSLSLVHADLHPGQNHYRVRARFRGVLSAFSEIASVQWLVTDQDVWTGLVSYWPLDELSDDGLTTPDLVSGNPLTLQGMDAGDLVAGQRGQAMAFNGTDQFLVHITPPGADTGLPISRSPSFTITLWVNGIGTGQSDRRVFSESSTLDHDPLFNLGTHVTGANSAVDVLVRNSGPRVPHFQSARPGFDGLWRHLAWSEHHGEAALYVDGILEQTFSYPPGPTPMNVTSVGAILRATSSFHFTGMIDEVAVWERALTQAAIHQVMTQGIETPIPGFPPVITRQSASAVLLSSAHPYTLSVQATGTRPLRYEWRKNGLPLGTNQPELVLPHLLPADSGSYVVEVSNSAGSVLSAEINLVVSAPTPDLTRELIAYWPLDEILGSQTPDLINAYDLDLMNLTDADLVPGFQGRAISFDADRHTLATRVHSPDEELPANQHTSFTISMRTKISGISQPGRSILSEAHTEHANPLFRIGTGLVPDSSHLDLLVRQTADEFDNLGVVGPLPTLAEPLDGRWHHWVFVQDAGHRRLYVNGTPDALDIPAKPTGHYFLNNTSLGGILRGSASDWVSGVIDEVSIWKRALTQEEITLLHTEGLPQAQPRMLRIETAAALQTQGFSTFEVTWASTPGAVYTLQRKTSLTDAEWTDVVTNVLSGGTTTTFSHDSGGQATGFYRILLAP